MLHAQTAALVTHRLNGSAGSHKAGAQDRWATGNDPTEGLLQSCLAEPFQGSSCHSGPIHRRLSSPLCRYARSLSPFGRDSRRHAAYRGQNAHRCSPTTRTNILIDSRRDYRHVDERPSPDGRGNLNIYLRDEAILSPPYWTI